MNLLMLTYNEVLEAQQNNTYSRNMFNLVGTNAWLTVNKIMLICREAPIDVSEHVIIPEVFRQAIFNNWHYTIMAGHLNTRRIYNKLQRQFCWPQTAKHVCAYVTRVSQVPEIGFCKNTRE